MNLHTDTWKPFLLHKIFTVDYGTKLDIGKMTHTDPKISFVTRTSRNNGVSGIVDEIPNIIPYQAGALTLALGGSLGACFVQQNDFYTSQNVAVIIPNEKLSLETKLFVSRIITLECQTRYQAFGRELNSHLKTDLSICLPCTTDGSPDWEFMHKYINSLKSEAKKQAKGIISITNGDINTIRNISGKFDINVFEKWANPLTNHPLTLSTSDWKAFEIGKLFYTYTGGDLIIGSIDEGEIPVISHSGTNNSISTYSSEISGRKLFNHTTTLSLADRGTFFATIQPEDFYIGTRVKALEAKYSEISMYSLMFISIIINNEQYRFNYGRNCTGNLDKLVIYLPAKKDFTYQFSNEGYCPDWEWMDKYIKSLPYSNRI